MASVGFFRFVNLALVRRQLPRPTKSHAFGLRTGTAVCTGEDQLTLELRQATEDREHPYGAPSPQSLQNPLNLSGASFV
jgi:hypothetical protein